MPGVQQTARDFHFKSRHQIATFGDGFAISIVASCSVRAEGEHVGKGRASDGHCAFVWSGRDARA